MGGAVTCVSGSITWRHLLTDGANVQNDICSLLVFFGTLAELPRPLRGGPLVPRQSVTSGEAGLPVDTVHVLSSLLNGD
jgi:hypothetical protein